MTTTRGYKPLQSSISPRRSQEIAFVLALLILYQFSLLKHLHNATAGLFLEPMTSPPVGTNTEPHQQLSYNGNTLIIAVTPKDKEHIAALWSQLTCLTAGVDHIVIAAPDVSWSRLIVSAVVTYARHRLHLGDGPQKPTIEAFYFVNDRYDAGLWCDGLLKVMGHKYWSPNGTVMKETSYDGNIFMINDSVFILRQYDEMVKFMSNETNHYDLVSMNGAGGPNSTTPETPFWLESVYRGFSSNGLKLFVDHTCKPQAFLNLCPNAPNKRVKRCIVQYFEVDLASKYPQDAVHALYPTYPPHNFPNRQRFWNSWIQNQRYYDLYLRKKLNFLLAKVKNPRMIDNVMSNVTANECSDKLEDSFLDNLIFPDKTNMTSHVILSKKIVLFRKDLTNYLFKNNLPLEPTLSDTFATSKLAKLIITMGLRKNLTNYLIENNLPPAIGKYFEADTQ